MGFSIQTKTYDVFNGIKQDISESSLTPDYAIIAQNCRYTQGSVDTPSAVVHRNGFEKLIKHEEEANVLGIYQFKTEGESYLLTCIDEFIYLQEGVDLTEIKDGQDKTNKYSFATLNSNAYICNSVDEPLKFGDTKLNGAATNDIVLTNMSIAQPYLSGTVANDLTLTVSSGGSLSVGNYYYTYTYSNSYTYQESAPYDLLKVTKATTNSANKTVTLSKIRFSSDPQVDKVNIYRTTVGGSIYDAQFLVSVANTEVSSTGYIADVVDNGDTTDLLLGNAIQLFHDPAPKFKKIVTHQNKIIGFTEYSTRLYISYDFNGWYFPIGTYDAADNFTIEINKDDGEYIKNIVAYMGMLLIFKGNSIWVLEGYDQTDFRPRQIKYDGDIGCVGINAAITKNNLVYFVDKSGIFATDGNSVIHIGTPVQGFFNNINLINYSPIDRSRIDEVVIGVDNYKTNKIIKFSFVPSGGTVNTLHLVYNYISNSWSIDTNYFATCYASYEDTNVEYLLRGDDLGFVFKESTQNYDNNFEEGATDVELGTSTLTHTGKTWEENEFKNCYITILSGINIGVHRRIESNTNDTITIYGTWTGDVEDGGKGPLDTSLTKYIIGSSDFVYISGWDNYGDTGYTKRLKYVRPRIKSLKNYTLDIFSWYDFNTNFGIFKTVDIYSGSTYDSGVIWGNFIWGQIKMDEIFKGMFTSSIHRYNAFGIRCYDSTAALSFNNYDKIYQIKGLGIR